jgi:hypothetical protein
VARRKRSRAWRFVGLPQQAGVNLWKTSGSVGGKSEKKHITMIIAMEFHWLSKIIYRFFLMFPGKLRILKHEYSTATHIQPWILPSNWPLMKLRMGLIWFNQWTLT